MLATRYLRQQLQILDKNEQQTRFLIFMRQKQVVPSRYKKAIRL